MSFWLPLLAAGAQLAKGMLQDDREDRAFSEKKDNLLLEIQDRERDRVAALERQRLSSETALQAANLSLEGVKKKILGEALLNRGKSQSEALLEDFKSSANKKDRSGEAMATLAALLSKGGGR